MQCLDKGYKINQVIWGKVSGYPWWPGFIKSIKKNTYEISFFGDFTRSYLKKSKIKKFNNESIHSKAYSTRLLESIDSAKKVNDGLSTLNEEILKVEKKLEIENKKNTENFEIEEEEIINENNLKEIEENNLDIITTGESKLIIDKKDSIIDKMSPKKTFLEPLLEFDRNDTSCTNLSEFKNNDFKDFEIKLEYLCRDFNTYDLTSKEDINKFEEIINEILNMDIISIYNSNIGKYLNLLFYKVQIIFKENSDFDKIFSILKSSIEKLKIKILTGFYKTETSNIFNFPKKVKKIQKIKKVKKKKNKKPSKEKSIREKKKFVIVNNYKISQDTIYQVCRKLAKNFLTNYPYYVNKSNCEEISKNVEENLRKSSNTFQGYQNNIIEFNKKMISKKIDVNFLINKANIEDFEITTFLKEDSILNN